MRQENTFDLVIVGGGLAGASLALALVDQPLKIAVIEAKDELRPDDRALALSFSSALILKNIGIWTAIAPQATPILSVHVSDANHFNRVRMTAAELNTPALGYVILAQAILNHVQQQVRQRSEITWICPAQLQAAQRSDSGYELQLATAQGDRTVHTRLLVAADGSDSPTRQCLGITTSQQEYPEMAVSCRITAAEHHGVAFERFSPAGILAALPVAPQERVVIWTVPRAKAEQLLQMDSQAFQETLQQAWGYRLGAIRQVMSRRAFPLRSMKANQSILPGALLLGNAAHTLHPVAAQGFNLTLRDIAVLAEVIANAVSAGKNPGDLSVLEEYQQRRSAEQQQLLWATDGLVSLFSSTWLPFVLGRNMGLLGLTVLPPLKRVFAKKAMGLSGALPKLVRGVALLTDPIGDKSLLSSFTKSGDQINGNIQAKKTIQSR